MYTSNNIRLLLVATLLVLLSTFNIVSADYEDHAISTVTYGSIIKLGHVATKFRLHSHKVAYGSQGGGSGQQSVTGFPENDDTNSLWMIKGPHGQYRQQGTIIKNGDTIRLIHLNTRKNLHSHLAVSPLTKNNEVSCFGENGEGDTGDNWVVELIDAGDQWTRDVEFRLKHVDTKAYLTASANYKYQHPIPGQLEVCGMNKKDADTKWKAEEGIYFEERQDI
ncbi:hypothetical protein SAMD00019534_009480 [Acytostelium subglobosum LB1]|uniref:hypothetical protein n=1 Tax=Acytostelium subglobosum LB1 TaxID=1410327 RepID=UPI000644BBBB|nr:hypothetical protein SAMD00019534_009480 [Acytostelium subglobosum LB1]GAM17773.1 hypothetical protein SAMD00019534_009480 [Acytostelium subglobosum LB1]|eukprot:XP_012758369.1 hypothetical protein SAMD00019534_009480 [Acytostelium subglobosum LB1]